MKKMILITSVFLSTHGFAADFDLNLACVSLGSSQKFEVLNVKADLSLNPDNCIVVMKLVGGSNGQTPVMKQKKLCGLRYKLEGVQSLPEDGNDPSWILSLRSFVGKTKKYACSQNNEVTIGN